MYTCIVLESVLVKYDDQYDTSDSFENKPDELDMLEKNKARHQIRNTDSPSDTVRGKIL
jgi:hypothetical protein